MKDPVQSSLFQESLPATLTFEEALAQLEDIVARMEQDDLALEETIKMFERGMQLSSFCSEKLAVAENKIQILMKDKKQKFKLKNDDQ